MATRDAGTCECPSEDLQTAHTNRRSDSARSPTSPTSTRSIDAGGGFEWKRHANWSLRVEYDHIFRRSDTLI
jgi:hypothetical protein